MIKKNDIKLIGVILVMAFIAIVIANILKTDGSKVVITIDGKEYESLDLNINKTLTIQGNDGEYNTLTIKDGVVSMIDASCPDQLCVKHKGIHYDNESIVCLPHKMILKIINGEDNGVDIIAK